MQRARVSIRGLAGLVALASQLGLACSKADHPPSYRAKQTPSNAGGTGSGGDGGSVVSIPVGDYDASAPPPPDAAGFCGNQVMPLRQTRSNLYLVLDRSGSMSDMLFDPVTGRRLRKYDASLMAIHDVMLALGHRLAYGAAVFPSYGVLDSCEAGGEVFPVTDGDSVTWALNGKDGPTLTRLMDALDLYIPEGSTPTSATLAKLVEPLMALGGETTVVLATDGAPNCNSEAVCDLAHCTANIENWPLPDGTSCGTNFNCCADAYYGPGNCVDLDATLVPIAQLLAHGIKTYVVGLPGTEAYADVLSRLAKAGGTARTQRQASDPVFYPVADAEQLTTALKGITAEISISCNVTLDAAPPDWTQVNVYFDNSLVKMNAANGWKQVDNNTLEVTGTYCDVLHTGEVFQVQVVSGCATEVLL